VNGTANGTLNKHSERSSEDSKAEINGVSEKVNGFAASETNGGISSETSNGVSSELLENSNEAANFPETDIVIIHGDSESQKLLAAKLADVLELSTEKKPVVGTLAEVNPIEKLCLFLSELDKPLLSNLAETDFTALQKALTTVQGVLWIVRGAYATSENPNTNMVTGLSRSIRSETLLKFATLDLDSRAPLSDELTVKAILDVFKAVFGSKAEANCELEFMERQGSFFTPRIINDTEMNEYVHKQTKTSTLEATPFSQPDRPLKMVIGTPGVLDTLHFVDDQTLEATLAEDEIEIEVKAIGMNSRDIMAATNQLETNGFGVECSGVITQVGNHLANFAIGDRVTGVTVSHGVYATYTEPRQHLR
jgi:hypothetical protein